MRRLGFTRRRTSGVAANSRPERSWITGKTFHWAVREGLPTIRPGSVCSHLGKGATFVNDSNLVDVLIGGSTTAAIYPIYQHLSGTLRS